MRAAGKLSVPDEDTARALYDVTQEVCAARGLPAYEVSNRARPGAECRHNLVSVVAAYADGSIIEMATIGREGCTGVQAIFGAKSSSVQLLVQIPGSATRMSRAAFTRAMGSMPSFRNLMYAYVHAFLEQVLVSVACNGAHSLPERLARWLLMMRDRSDDDALPITQSLLAEMLGVQRPTITNAA
jgi:CRP-like cAMP-binding protein